MFSFIIRKSRNDNIDLVLLNFEQNKQLYKLSINVR